MKAARSFACSVMLLLLCRFAAGAQQLPATLDPPAPFPRIFTDAPTIEPIAPGVTSGSYDLSTAAGPIAVHVVAIAPHRDDIRLDTEIANGALTSRGETISSMAARSGAVAGINGDYFDIGNTNQPTNIVVRGGELLRTPRKRASLVITKTGGAQIVENAFAGQADIGGRSVTIDAVNEMPPPGGGVSLLTPEFGSVAPDQNLTLIALAPTGGAPPFAQYRVATVADNLSPQPPGYYLAVGLSAYTAAGVPNPGDPVVTTGDLSPVALEDISAAVGGGPMILHDGAWYDDPDGPTGGEYSQRIPSSGAAIEPDGTLLLIVVDGRAPERSVGVTRPEFAALMRGLGAREGLAFDGGGSAEMVTRALGSRRVTAESIPSDGMERRVADGLFVFNTDPTGAANRLVTRPQTVRAVAGATVTLHPAALDAADHVVDAPTPIRVRVQPSALGTYHDGTFDARQAGSGYLVLTSGAIRATTPITVFAEPAHLRIFPAHPNVAENGALRLTAQATTARGFAIALPVALEWHSTQGRISGDGMLQGATHDAIVSVHVGSATSSTTVSVGSHAVALPFAASAHFGSIPRAGAGSLERHGTSIALQYALGSDERAAYALADTALPSGAIAVTFDVRGGGPALRLRIALRNAINEQVLLSASMLEGSGWRHVVVPLPPDLQAPARLSAIYVIGKDAAVRATGTIEIRDVRAVVAGLP